MSLVSPSKSPKQAEIDLLQKESSSLFNKLSPRRCASYKPTLSEFQSIAFEDYIRYNILGIECECCHGTKQRKLRRHNSRTKSVEYQTPCKYKLNDGIAKITTPKGWWNHKGIGGDLTGRGPSWAAGTALGDYKVLNPIKQLTSGMAGVYEFTMLVTPPKTIASFREQADEYRRRQIGSPLETEEKDDKYYDQLALKFWKRLGPTMEPPFYGADLEGTLFGGADASGWNVDKLDSCLQLLRADDGASPAWKAGEKEGTMLDLRLPGVTSAYLYFGMWASVFAAHTEDMNLLSINYLHAGAPKYWYSISPVDSHRFETLASSHFAQASQTCPEFLRHKRYLLSPSILRKAGIRYVTQIQRPGEIIITFPNSYHFGFNTGFNVAESTNFAIPEWVDLGNKAGICMCHPHSVRIDMGRFKKLLQEYEAQKSLNPLSYSEFVIHKWKLHEDSSDESDHSNAEGGSSSIPQSLNKAPTYKQATVVHVANPPSAVTTSPKQKSKKREAPADQLEYLRLALRVRPNVYTRNTQVLCLIPPSTDLYLCGIVKTVCENHVRIHIHGRLSKDDVWMERNSHSLFLNAGMVTEEDRMLEKKRKSTVVL